MCHQRYKIIPSAIVIFITIIWVSACSSANPSLTATLPVATQDLPTPAVRTTNIPPAINTARKYLNAWEIEDYPGMYDLLSNHSKELLSIDQFTQKYSGAMDEIAVGSIGYETNAETQTTGDSIAQVPYRVRLNSNLVGSIERDTVMNLVLEDGEWRIDFDETMILPELTDGNLLRMDLNPLTRSPIYDRNGNPLAVQADAVSIGFYPDNVDPEFADELYGLLARVSGLKPETIQGYVDKANPGDYIPLGQLAADQSPGLVQALTSYGAVVTNNYNSRYYPGNGTAPHLVGYVRQIDKEELSEFRRKGYRIDEKVGRKGIESNFEDTLTGKHGGTLYVVDQSGQPVVEIGSSVAEPGQAIYTTIDDEFQRGVQEALRGYNGAAVVMERDTGRVLAIASSPGFDPNAFQTENYNWYTTLAGFATDPNLPEFNRASEGQYPLGSVFKIITTAAALESGLFTPESIYDCQYAFTELSGLTLYDWTYERFQEDGETQPSGILTLPQGLIRSCNPWFYHIGKVLFENNLGNKLVDMAKGFGLGSLTGINSVNEVAGNITAPQTVFDATNMSTGQGDLQVTPLQVADFIAAVGNGGTLYRPQTIEKIVSQDGTVTYEFEPEIRGKLPVKPENLKVIQDAMRSVITSRNPLGTAFKVFNGMRIPVFGKTGTAENGTETPHSWFAAYTSAGNPSKPDIAVAVITEFSGEASEISAPITRRIIELYFNGRPGKLYPWESSYGVWKTPEPPMSETPTPEAGTP